MKILILTNSSSGLYSFRQELIAKLLENHEVTAYTPDSGDIEKLEALGCRICTLKMDRRGINPLSDFKLLWNIRSILLEELPDLVITYTIKPNIYGGLVCRLLSIPYAVNITGLGTAFQNDNWLKKLVTILYKSALAKVKVVFFENDENRQIFIQNSIVSKDKTCLLMGAGVNLERFRVLDYPKGDVTKFLFIGRVMKEKGIDELFAAMKRLVAEGVPCTLDICGGYEENYQSTIDKYVSEGWLTYHGNVPDVRPYIKECHCFVLPSWHEGMANTNLESAASGRPVITSNIHGCLEAVEDGVSGYLCETKNSEDLYNTMQLFINLPNEQRINMGLVGRKRMELFFDKKKVVFKTLQIIFH